MSDPEKKAKLLIVDDSDDARIGLKHFFESEGYLADEAECGETAVELFRENVYDVVITDLKMQDIDGIGVLKAARSAHPETEVIIMTAYASVDSAVGAMKLGAYDYISKPLNLDEVHILVDKCLEKQRLAKEVSGLKQVINLYESSKGISSIMNLEELLNLIVELARDALNAEGGSIMLLDEEAGVLEVKAASGRRSDIVIGRRVKLGDRISGYAAKLREDIMVEGNVKNDSRFGHIDSYDGINSAITVPLVSRKRLLGVVNLHRSKFEKGFTDNDIKLLSIFAAQAAVAIENSSLFDNLSREKDKLNTLFSEMSDGAVLLDKEMKVVMHNNSASALLGEDLENGNIQVKLSGFTSTVPLRELMNTPEPVHFELSREKPTPLYLSAAFTAIKGEKSSSASGLLVFRDVTEVKKEEKVKKNFLRLMSHKLRTPLTSIIGFTSILNENETLSRLSEEEKDFLKTIDENANHLSELVDRLLRFTLLESEDITLSKRNTVIEELVDDVLSELRPSIEESGTEVEKTGLRDIRGVFVDGDKVREAIENIIENALKFNTSRNKKLFIQGVQEAGTLKLVIEDNGPGIPPGDLETVFEKFSQLEKSFTGQVEGVGLGLTLARRIAEAHGGRLRAENRKDGGCAFIMTLPI